MVWREVCASLACPHLQDVCTCLVLESLMFTFGLRCFIFHGLFLGPGVLQCVFYNFCMVLPSFLHTLPIFAQSSLYLFIFIFIFIFRRLRWHTTASMVCIAVCHLWPHGWTSLTPAICFFKNACCHLSVPGFGVPSNREFL